MDPKYGDQELKRQQLRDLEDAKRTATGVKTDKTISSSEKFIGKSTIFGRDEEHNTPYMTRRWIGRLRLHIFHRGDQDPDCHDHPWDFWTFPLHPYVEEVVQHSDDPIGPGKRVEPYKIKKQIVPALRWTFRPATHCHRVIARWSGAYRLDPVTHEFEPVTCGGSIVTLVWRSHLKRKWGFLKRRDGSWCWTPWKVYIFDGGKDAPCS